MKIIAHECDNLVDEFVPELVDTLASQMNPTTVCSVAGLCNNARIDKLLEEAKEKDNSKAVAKPEDDCQGCHTVVDSLEHKFQTMTREQVLHGFLKVYY